jgi:hypothetical protein
MIRAQPVRVRLAILGVVTGTILALGSEGRADVINFTGNVANDFPASSGAEVIQGTPYSVAEAPYIIQNGWTTGFLIDTVRVVYNQATDTLYVGVQGFSIIGDADGNPNQTGADPQLKAAGGVNLPNFGGDKSLTVAFASVAPGGGVGTTDFVAGIPANKASGNSANTNDFTVATYNNTGRGLAYSYGTILNGHVGSLAVSPTASAPDFEFALTNFSKIPGFNPDSGFYVSLFLGSQQAIVVGKEALGWTLVPGTVAEPGGISGHSGSLTPPTPGVATPAAVPEPGSVVLLLVAATTLGLARFRRRSA